MPFVLRKTLWRAAKLCKVGPRAPHKGPATRVLTASLGMCAHDLDGMQD